MKDSYEKWLISKFLYVFENSDVIQYGLIVEGICNLIVSHKSFSET